MSSHHSKSVVWGGGGGGGLRGAKSFKISPIQKLTIVSKIFVTFMLVCRSLLVPKLGVIFLLEKGWYPQAYNYYGLQKFEFRLN